MCCGAVIQNMGTASKLIRLMIIILLGIILWHFWYYVSPIPETSNSPPVVVVRGKDVLYQTEHLEVVVPAQLKIVVFYEALCPDSKDFVSRELKPTYHSMKDAIALNLIPYGKAQSRILEDGTYSFSCQHGEVECQANIVHGCVTKYVSDTSKSLDIVSCMIDINLRSRNPLQDGEKCVKQFGEKWTPIEKCSTGKEGKDILYHMGKMTHDLNPPVTFIPTITINGSRENQNLILRDFKKAVCNLLAGTNQSPESCNFL